MARAHGILAEEHITMVVAEIIFAVDILRQDPDPARLLTASDDVTEYTLRHSLKGVRGRSAIRVHPIFAAPSAHTGDRRPIQARGKEAFAIKLDDASIVHLLVRPGESQLTGKMQFAREHVALWLLTHRIPHSMEAIGPDTVMRLTI